MFDSPFLAMIEYKSEYRKLEARGAQLEDKWGDIERGGGKR